MNFSCFSFRNMLNQNDLACGLPENEHTDFFLNTNHLNKSQSKPSYTFQPQTSCQKCVKKRSGNEIRDVTIANREEKIRVMIFTESFHPYTSGIARRFKEIIRRLVKRNFLIHVVTGCKVNFSIYIKCPQILI